MKETQEDMVLDQRATLWTTKCETLFMGKRGESDNTGLDPVVFILISAFTDDQDALLNHLKLPINRRKSVRTSNLAERGFEEARRRTKIIPRFLTEKSGLKLVYSVLIRAATRRRRVPVTSFDLLSLDRLREVLGIEDETIDVQADIKEVRR